MKLALATEARQNELKKISIKALLNANSNETFLYIAQPPLLPIGLLVLIKSLTQRVKQ